MPFDLRKCLFSFVINWQTVFQDGCISLHFHHRYVNDPVYLYPCQHLLLNNFHVFTCRLYILFSEMCVSVLCLFSNCIVWFLLLSFESSLYILDISYF